MAFPHRVFPSLNVRAPRESLDKKKIETDIPVQRAWISLDTPAGVDRNILRLKRDEIVATCQSMNVCLSNSFINIIFSRYLRFKIT